MAKKKNILGFVEKMKKIHQSGLTDSPPANRATTIDPDLTSLSERVEKLMGFIKRDNQNSLAMIYFVMYDIEDNKVRTQVAKYLIRKGCTRVQKSIFIANTDRTVFSEIQKDLKAVQECYDNNDSVLLIPISTDEIRAMKLIGKNIDFDLAIKNRNTLFF
jgi:CRISPR-associated protein Cas2